jgi:hypothetical protein
MFSEYDPETIFTPERPDRDGQPTAASRAGTGGNLTPASAGADTGSILARLGRRRHRR